MIIIIGAGLAGLTAAKTLADAGHEDFLVLEASPKVGGVIQTTRKDGYVLDHGFQVLLDSYPAVRKHLDLDTLDLCPFDSGALLVGSGKPSRMHHPLRHPLSTLGSLINTGGLSPAALLPLVQAFSTKPRPDESAAEFLTRCGASQELFNRFLKPFFGGVLLDPELKTDAQHFRDYLTYFTKGRALVPRKGMAAIVEQLACRIPKNKLLLNSPVAALEPNAVRLENGELINASHIILATDATTTQRFFGSSESVPHQASAVAYLLAENPPYPDRLIALPEQGAIQHFVPLTNINPNAAPDNKNLIAASFVGEHATADEDALLRLASTEITQHFPNTGHLEPHSVLRVTHAIPHQTPNFRDWQKELDLPRNITLAGQQIAQASINGSMTSGEDAALRALSTHK